MMKYYVLGKKNNEMLTEYVEKYYQLLLNKLSDLISADVYNNLVKNTDHKIFLMSGDISSIINRLTIIGNKNNAEFGNLFTTLNTQIKIFLGDQSKTTINHQGTLIGNTHIRLTTQDFNPYNVFDAHPEHKSTGGILGWGERPKQEWLDLYKKTFELLKNVDEGFYDELNTIIQKIIPLGTSRELHNSASYMYCVGHLYMGYTLGVDQPELSNLEAIIHESSHNKLNLLFHFDPLILNSLEENYYSPFRPDARHLKGIFLAIHAFVPTIYILMKAYKNGFIQQENWLHKIVLYYIKNKITFKVLKKYAHFSEMGEEIMIEIEYVMKQTDIVFKSLFIPKNIITHAISLEKNHFQSVNTQYPNFKY